MAITPEMKHRLSKATKGKVVADKAAAPVSPDLLKDKTKALVEIQSKLEVIKILKITTEEDYAVVDEMVGWANGKLTWWASRMDPIIDPMQSSLNAARRLDREVRQPIEGGLEHCKKLMADYLIEKNKRIAREEMEKEERAEDLRKQDAQLAKKVEVAVAPKLKVQLAQRRMEIQEQIAETEQEQPTEAPVQAVNSQARYQPAWRLTSLMDVILAVARGDIKHDEILQINEKWLNAYFKEHPEQVMEWPGIEVYEKPIIAGVRS